MCSIVCSLYAQALIPPSGDISEKRHSESTDLTSNTVLLVDEPIQGTPSSFAKQLSSQLLS